MTSGQMIDYEALAQDAMRGVVRAVLTRVAKDAALPGDHHFYISFDTQAPGVSMSKRLKEKYPHEMTIVLQHRFWDLVVSDERFEVKLTFDSIPERLIVPFAAIKVFFDPSVRYGLQFEDPDAGPEASGPFADLGADGRATTTRSSGPRKPRPARKPRPERDNVGAPVSPLPSTSNAPPPRIGAAPPAAKPRPAAVPPSAGATESPDKVVPAAASAEVKETAPEPAGTMGDKPAGDKPAAPPGAQIVSLDAFRKK
jgi:hypothetical protein